MEIAIWPQIGLNSMYAAMHKKARVTFAMQNISEQHAEMFNGLATALPVALRNVQVAPVAVAA